MFLASCVKRWRIIDIGFPSSFYTFLSWLTSAFRNQKTSLSLSLSLSLSRSICACHRCAGANANLLCIIPILSDVPKETKYFVLSMTSYSALYLWSFYMWDWICSWHSIIRHLWEAKFNLTTNKMEQLSCPQIRGWNDLWQVVVQGTFSYKLM